MLMSRFKVGKAPDKHHWTLRFKCHKTTVFLFVNDNQPFASIKSDLLEAIKATGIQDVNGTPLPLSSEDIILGVPIDKKRIDKGWVSMEIPDIGDDQTPESKSKARRKSTVFNAHPLGAGLKDGDMLAFKFRTEGLVQRPADEIDFDDGDWDVILPSYDEEDAMQEEAQAMS